MNNHRQGRPLDHALIDRIHRLHQAGHPYRAIARETGVSYNTVKKYTTASQTHDPLSRRTASGPLSLANGGEGTWHPG